MRDRERECGCVGVCVHAYVHAHTCAHKQKFVLTVFCFFVMGYVLQFGGIAHEREHHCYHQRGGAENKVLGGGGGELGNLLCVISCIMHR